jgi:hypothetical protein
VLYVWWAGLCLYWAFDVGQRGQRRKIGKKFTNFLRKLYARAVFGLIWGGWQEAVAGKLVLWDEDRPAFHL